MNTTVKIAGFAAALVVLGGAGYAVGAAFGPTAGAAGEPGIEHEHVHVHGHGAGPPGGLAPSSGGYAMVPTTSTLVTGRPGAFSFRITGPDGAPVTAFDVRHDKWLHLVVVRRDTTGFRHLHPEMGPGIRFVAEVPSAGSYRLFLDFQHAGVVHTAELTVPAADAES